jgi:mRNA-degrading endonuclease toxin of MazEF toxin-antitoxin module
LSSAATPSTRRCSACSSRLTTRVSDLPSELALGPAEGPVRSVASFDNIRPFPKTMLVRRLGSLGPRQHEICRAAGATLDC